MTDRDVVFLCVPERKLHPDFVVSRETAFFFSNVNQIACSENDRASFPVFHVKHACGLLGGG
jgi:hypothetical protein